MRILLSGDGNATSAAVLDARFLGRNLYRVIVAVAAQWWGSTTAVVEAVRSKGQDRYPRYC